MVKLSEQLKLLAERAAAIEGRAEAARKEAAERREAKLADVRTRLEAQHQAFTKQVTAASDDTKAAWLDLKDSLQSARDKVRSDVDKGVRTLKLKDMELSADLAETYAYDAVEFALLAVAEADAAVMESIAARAQANQAAAG
jgi:hypothetical protein